MAVKRFWALASLGGYLLFSALAHGQAFPTRPVRINASEPGGGGDFVARLIAQGIAGPLGQPVIVENRPGVTAGQTVSAAQPDGHTLLVYGNSIWTGSLLQKIPYEAERDFSPITLATRSPNILVVHPSLRVKSVKDLIALAKANPGALNYGAGATGGAPHLSGELFKALAGVDIVTVFYKGTGPAVNDLIGGQVQLMFATPGSVVPHIKSGRLRALAVTSAQSSVLFPDLPTVAAAVPAYQSTATFGVWAPMKTPEPVIRRLNQVIVGFLHTAEAKERLLHAGVEAVGSSPEEFAATIRAEMILLGKVIKSAGIRVDQR